MPEEILRQIREEMQRSFNPRERQQSIEQLEAAQPSSGELLELRSALGALYASYALVGQTPPEPPTLRGRMGARLVKLVQRLLFWYTPQIVHFQYSALQTFESALRVIERQANRVQQLETELQHERNDRETAVAAALSRAETVAAAALSRTETLERRLETLRLQVFPRINSDVMRLKAQQTVQEGRMALLIQAPGQPQREEGLNREELHNMDALYAALEDEFRGSRQEIKERLTLYLAKLAEAGIGSESMPVLDVGCGRGEWVELLREHQLYASGIDLNRVVLTGSRSWRRTPSNTCAVFRKHRWGR
jgi:2-polyprenyl-3-methyl-5-hydroxy-6-metoxy-1,4-benzoquinol methylase